MFKKIISLTICIIFCVSFAFGCNTQNKNEKDVPTHGDNDDPIIVKTEHDLVSNGASDYKIVLPENADSNEKFAQSEVLNFFYQATDIKLPVVTDSSVSYSPNANLIVLGRDNSLLKNTDIDVSDLGPQSYVIKTIDKNVFIVGSDSYGTLFGSYDFLSYTVGYECYAPDEIHVDHYENLKLPEFDITDGPDIQWRKPSYMGADNYLASSRMKLTSNVWMQQRGNWVHNGFTEYFSRYKDNESSKGDSEIFEKHPKWFASSSSDKPDGNVAQLCFSAHGDDAELALMQNAVFERMKEIIKLYWDVGDFRTAISLTQEDNHAWCSCSKCSEERRKYGTNAAVVIHFLNPVAQKVKEWIDSVPEYKGHNVDIIFFAYYETIVPPVKNINGSYELVDETVKCNDNLKVMYAPIEADYFRDFNDAANILYKQYLEMWSLCCKNIYVWTYGTSYRNYVSWYNTFDSMQANYELFNKNDVKFIYVQCKHNDYGMTGFDVFKQYLQAKLSWNINANVEDMTNNFFDNYFRDASSAMRKYYESFRSWQNYLVSNKGIKGDCYITITKDYYPKQLLATWLDYIDEAYVAIEPLKSQDLTLYQTIKDRITCESIAVRYQMIDFYGPNFNSLDLLEMKKSFKADAERLRFVLSSEQGTLEDIYKKWGIL